MIYRIISADSHIDLGIMPPDVFVSDAPPHWKAKIPRVVESDEGPTWVVGDLAIDAEGVYSRKVPLS
jgi:hypothetical protein